MKKTTKRVISLLLAVLILMPTAISASAACDHQGGYPSSDPRFYEEVLPTCTEWGYTIYHCSICHEKNVHRSPDNVKPLEHKIDLDNPVYVPVNAEGIEVEDLSEELTVSYHKYFPCIRNFEDGQCSFREYEMVGEEKADYYLVKFINHKVTGSYDASVEYAKVVDINTYKQEEVYSCLVKEGEAAVFDGDKPYREKTKEYPKYNFVGWSEEALDCVFFADDTDPQLRDETLAEISTNLDNIQKNTVFYPVFEAVDRSKVLYDVDVYIYDENNNLKKGTVTQKIPHGSAPAFSYNGVNYPEPVMKENIVESYEFIGWKYGKNGSEDKLLSTAEMTNSTTNPIYGNTAMYPCFKTTAKDYTLRFRNWNGDVLKNGYYDAVFSGIHLKTNALSGNFDLQSFIGEKENMARPQDDSYIYEWTGEWKSYNTGILVDLKNIDITTKEFVEENGEKIIDLIPVYNRRMRTYKVTVKMVIPESEDMDYYKGGAVVQITDKFGQLAASGTTDADGIFVCKLNNNPDFAVSVATADEKYIGNNVIRFLHDQGDGVECRVDMTLNPNYETHCSCICHNSLLRPIWVRILNILYNLFKVKYVCCYDMYTNLGPMLDYTK